MLFRCDRLEAGCAPRRRCKRLDHRAIIVEGMKARGLRQRKREGADAAEKIGDGLCAFQFFRDERLKDVLAFFCRLQKTIRRDADHGISDVDFRRSQLRKDFTVRRDAREIEARHPAGDFRGRSRIEFPLPAQCNIEAVISLCDMRLGALAVAQDRAHHAAQAGHEREHLRRQHQTFVHVHDGVRFRGMKADQNFAAALCDLEHRAPSRCRCNRHGIGNIGILKTMARERAHDHLALERAIFHRRQILISAAAAGSEMDTDVRLRHGWLRPPVRGRARTARSQRWIWRRVPPLHTSFPACPGL